MRIDTAAIRPLTFASHAYTPARGAKPRTHRRRTIAHALISARAALDESWRLTRSPIPAAGGVRLNLLMPLYVCFDGCGGGHAVHATSLAISCPPSRIAVHTAPFAMAQVGGHIRDYIIYIMCIHTRLYTE